MWEELKKMADNIGYRLFLDDIRDAPGGDWVIARNAEEAKSIVQQKGFPSFISFDHDLGLEESGYDFAKWLVDYDMDNNVVPEDFSFNVHSANPVGATNIKSLLDNYISFKKSQ